MKSLKELSIAQIQDWKEFNAYRRGKHLGMHAGIAAIDRNVRGLTGIVGIQGEPGSCKSTMALQIAIENAKKGTPVFIVDRENGKHRFRERLLGNVCQITRKQILECSDEALRGYFKQVVDLPMFVATETLDLEQLRAYLEEMRTIFTTPILLVVDSLQALPRHGLDERQALEAWLVGFDQLKLDFGSNLVILMTSEKRRGMYREASNDGGKGTGTIEFKCELLFDMRYDLQTGIIFMNLVKNRDGACFADAAMRKVMASSEPNSFLFKLEETTIDTEDDL